MPTEEHFVSHIDFGDGVVRTIKDPNASGTAVVGVKGDAEESYRHGNVNITKGNIGLGNVENLKQVSATENQGLTDTEKGYARDNLGLGTSATLDVPASGDASSSEVVLGSDSRLTDSREASDVYSWAKASTKPSYNASEVGAVDVAMVGVAGGIAELDSLGKVPASQLPSYVDDVLEYADLSSFPATGESGKIYVAQDTNKTYRWSGSGYVVISETLALGETDSTAYRGDRGKTAYDHSQSTHARTDATKTESSSTNGNIKINGTETTVYTHPGSGTNPHGTTASDVGLGNVGNFKAVSTVASQGLTDTEKSNARANIGAGTSSLTIGTTATTAAAGNHTHGLSIATDSGTAAISLAANTTYKLTAGGSTYIFKTPVDNNTTYESKAAASGGTAVSLVTTGEKYTWNNKSNLAIGTTATTAAAGNHTHGLSIAADSGTSSISLAANTKYKITAGGSAYVFTTPADTNTNNCKSFYGTCATAAATAEKAVTLSNTTGWSLVAGVIVGVKFSNTNTAGTMKLNVNSSGAKQVWFSGAAYTGTDARITGWAGHVTYYMYDGTYWCFLNVDNNYINTNTTYSAGTGLSLSGTTFSVSTVPVANGGTGATNKRDAVSNLFEIDGSITAPDSVLSVTNNFAKTGWTSISDLKAKMGVNYGTTAGTVCQGNDSRLSNSRTPTAHASTATTYGVGNASNYGHVKLSDTWTSSVGAAANAIGASQAALYNSSYNATNKEYTFTGGKFALYKVGRIVYFQVYWSSSDKANNTTLTTLDAAYRPLLTYVARNAYDNQAGSISIESGGAVKYTSSNGTTSSWGTFSGSYIAST